MSFRIANKSVSHPKSYIYNKKSLMIVPSRFGSKNYFYRPRNLQQKQQVMNDGQFDQSLQSPIKYDPKDKYEGTIPTTAKKEFDEKIEEEEKMLEKQKEIYGYLEDLLESPIPQKILENYKNQENLKKKLFPPSSTSIAPIASTFKTKKIHKYPLITDRFNNKIYYSRKRPTQTNATHI